MRFLVLKKKTFLFVFMLIVCFSLLSTKVYGTPVASIYFGNLPRLIPIYNVATDEKKVAITFDSAWGADKTEKIIQTLKDYNVNATFFLCGFWVEENPDLVKLIDENNIEIGTHSNTHPDLTTLSKESVSLELSTSCELIKNITQKDVRLFRAPFGAYNNDLINIADNMNIKTIQWDVDTLDWKGLSGVEICERVMSRVNNGSIILCHNNSDHILDALPLLLERLLNAGYEVVSVGELIYWDNYYIDHAGVQHLNSD